VYGLCATLYALMRGRPPRWREGYDPTIASLVDMFAEPVPDLPDVPVELTALLRRGMANDPAQRPDAAQLRDELAGTYRDPDPTMVLRPVRPGPTPDWPRWTPVRPGIEDEPTEPAPPRPRDGHDPVAFDGPTVSRPHQGP
jgi:serine/threonine protein kinase